MLVLVLAATPAEGAQVDDATAIAMAPQELIVAGDLKPATRAALLKPIDAFYGFWINGSPVLLDRALSPHFVDHMLPPGTPQGPTGPAIASEPLITDGTKVTLTKPAEGKFKVSANAWEDGATILADQVLEIRTRNPRR